MAAVTPSSSAAATGTGRARAMARTSVVWDYLRSALDELAAGRPLEVLDVGGGSGGFAVPVAQLGHVVTVVDPSPDALAALERRAAETDTADRVRGRQGDAAGVLELVSAGSVDVVLCHSVLEVVDDPAEALGALAAALRPGGIVSVLAASRVAAVVARASAGRLGEARQILDDPAGRAGDNDPLVRRFTLDELQSLIAATGLRTRTVHGARIFADTVPAPTLDTDPQAVDDLLALERAAAERPDYLAVATLLHVLAERG
jgi:S-adenosylmethionine-dependent methyltransferase